MKREAIQNFKPFLSRRIHLLSRKTLLLSKKIRLLSRKTLIYLGVFAVQFLDGFNAKSHLNYKRKIRGLIWFGWLLEIKSNQINAVWFGSADSIFYKYFIGLYINI